ncbi:hypothetical protein COV06_03035 [Candidatus Uhrbacteria bacterium CG10_big_fil_rev_8_21_14_0_10_50_16]|uniref:Bacterial spore germination immunoglobulin-like domain-containing protein n=1 Tax=Candidatus Uhrbacteria bacterium CG10_big_fil_rev_8_21_14_0_10_50_16 TaxID=1975039 RepID=A0A2H0RLR9_9BACT|nr:MAG: hypothetical protein COV06_03035 [Candidatus Uhrbacteria bacterium CG10_big_fil_rev_8_21_14_0_10_50_16]
MKKLITVFGALMFIGSGCLTVNVDINADQGEVPDVSLSIAADEVLEMATPSDNITVFEPLVSQEVDSVIFVEGEARVFEQAFTWRLTDMVTGNAFEGHETTSATDIGLFGPFSFSINVPADYGSNLLLEVFQYSAADGAQIDTVSIPLILTN